MWVWPAGGSVPGQGEVIRSGASPGHQHCRGGFRSLLLLIANGCAAVEGDDSKSPRGCREGDRAWKRLGAFTRGPRKPRFLDVSVPGTGNFHV